MKVIITGASGYVGEGVLRSCLEDPRIDEVLIVVRRSIVAKLGLDGAGASAASGSGKLKEYVVPDFMALTPGDERLQGYDAVYFCAGISSVGCSMTDYRVICHDIPLHFARCVGPQPSMIFTYVSGYGTSDKNPQEWAKIKSATEAELAQMPFKAVYWYRPCFMLPHPDQIFSKGFQVATRLIYPFAWLLGMGNTIRSVARSMITLTATPSKHPTHPIGVKEIRAIGVRPLTGV